MAAAARQPATPGKVKEMAAAVGLVLDEARAAALCPLVDQVSAMMDGLAQVDLGEAPPSFAFKSRWTDAPS